MKTAKAPVKTTLSLSRRIQATLAYAAACLTSRPVRFETQEPKDRLLSSLCRVVVHARTTRQDESAPALELNTTYYLTNPYLGLQDNLSTTQADAVIASLNKMYENSPHTKVHAFTLNGRRYRCQPQAALQLRRRPDDTRLKPGNVWIQESA